MTKTYPTPVEAEKIWRDGMEWRIKNTNYGPNDKHYVVHTQTLANFARTLAEHTSHLNPDKAYSLGLLHDYGKRIREGEANKFHGIEGYEAMTKLGYSDVARICITHTFPNKNFSTTNFGYPTEWMVKAKKIISDIEYDDYDRLIQLCDKLSDQSTITTIEDRALRIQKRYNGFTQSGVYKEITQEKLNTMIAEGLVLKNYFDRLCGVDVYSLLGIQK